MSHSLINISFIVVQGPSGDNQGYLVSGRKTAYNNSDGITWNETKLTQSNTPQPQPTILIVDDDWLNRELMEVILTSAGYRVIQASGGERALRMAAEHRPDLVLLDVRMPGIDGYTVCARLKAEDETAGTPVMLVTGLEEDVERKSAQEAGADALVSRLMPTDDLLSAIRDMLHRQA